LTSAFSYTSAGGGSLTCPNPGANRTQMAFNDQDTTVSDVAWTVSFIGKNNGDSMLDPGEKAVISVWLHSITTGTWSNYLTGYASNFIGTDYVDTYHTSTLEVKPVSGATLTIQRTTPAYLDSIVDLH
jgi:archaellin